MRLLRTLIVAAALLAASGQAGGEPAKVVLTDVPAGLEQVARQAVRAFEDACPLLFEYWADVEAAEGRINTPVVAPYREDRFGWRREVELRVRIKADPALIPDRYRAWGHTLHYYLGAGHQPGVVAAKAQSQRLCGLPPSSADQHKPVPALLVVDKGLGPVPTPEARTAALRTVEHVAGIQQAKWFGLMSLALDVVEDHPPVDELVADVCNALAEHGADAGVRLSFVVPSRGWGGGVGDGQCPL